MKDASPAPETVADKLPLEEEHLEALTRMRSLAPYYRWTLQLVKSYLGRRVMDAGCGIGNFVEQLSGRVEYILAVDLSPKNIAVLRQRFADCPEVEVAQIDLDAQVDFVAQRRLDTVVCLDVLEHVEDDLMLLRRFRESLPRGGTLIVKVPACPWLFGSIDVASGHFRRYTKRALVDKAVAAGWTPVRAFYMNIFGVLPYWLLSRVLKRPKNFSRALPRWQLAALRACLPLISTLDRLIGPPIGQSVILIARTES